MRKPITAALLLAWALAACSNESGPPAAASAASAASAPADACVRQDLAAEIRTALQKALADAAARAGARSDGMVDVAKMSAAAARLEVLTDKAAVREGWCHTTAAVTIPEDMLADAAKYAPLLGKKTPGEAFAAAGLNVSGGVLRWPLRYRDGEAGKTAVDGTDIVRLADVLADTLLPFAVKDTVMQKGRPVGRDEALRRLNNPLPEPAASAASVPEVPPVGDSVPNPPEPGALAASAPEVLQPQPPKSRISAQELENARQANEAAGSSIRSAWQSIDPDIQASLVEEQRNWEGKKQQSCRNAGAKGADRAEAQYLQIQCDTRLTRERVQYLKGYSIQ